ncbi:MAG TPA: ABC transporter ATP-binding protein [Acetobacteraceae bacterium]|jgi:NitT/TauT family transport system ATP-binding protein|nr:ABC transporter ATP-binding protein [Acetobacteraceae bacterium]
MVAGAPVRLARVSHRFELHGQPLPVLDAIDLAAEPGEFIALLGPSGCGKSTLLRLIAGLEQPSAGRILMRGQPIEAPDPSRILVFQDPTLFPWRTVRQNVALGLETRGVARTESARVDAVLRQVGLDGFDNAYPRQLSGGMAQRAALARALVNEPCVLLMDEPLANLDGLTRIGMQSELTALWQRRRFTAFMVTHDVEEALFMAGRVLVLSQRPARILAEIAVDLPYPRHRGSPGFAALRERVMEELGLLAQW